MADTLVGISTAIVTSLNAASLSVSFTAERKDRPPLNADDLTGEANPRVYVVPSDIQTVSVLSRKQSRVVDYFVDILVLKKGTIDTYDTYRGLMEEMVDHLMNAGRMNEANWIGSTTDSPFSEELFDTAQIFAGNTRQQYRRIR